MEHVPEETTPTSEEPKKTGSSGSVIGIVIIVVVLIAGAFYVWGERLEQQPQVPENGVRGELLPDATAEGSFEVGSGVNDPQPR